MGLKVMERHAGWVVHFIDNSSRIYLTLSNGESGSRI